MSEKCMRQNSLARKGILCLFILGCVVLSFLDKKPYISVNQYFPVLSFCVISLRVFIIIIVTFVTSIHGINI